MCSFKIYGIWPQTHTHTHNFRKCNHASEGLTQARPNEYSSLIATDNTPNIQDPPKDEDLSFLERKRLEEEYLKLKEQKKKAEHYAVEAKQTTQRVRYTVAPGLIARI